MLVGFGMNIICICVTLANAATVSTWMFNLNEYPDWLNTTVAA